MIIDFPVLFFQSDGGSLYRLLTPCWLRVQLSFYASPRKKILSAPSVVTVLRRLRRELLSMII